MHCRAKELDGLLQSRELSDARKEQKKSSMRKSEANFLRFLRTSERPQNYNTLKIIGKGAFGEVKLVQRKHDGKIYALKSLIKAEMVRLSFLSLIAHPPPWSPLSWSAEMGIDGENSTRKTSWRTCAPSATSSRTRTARGW